MMTCDRVVAWIVAYRAAIYALAVVLLATLATGLTRYPKAAGVVYWLRVVVGFIGVATSKDAAGTFKLPFTVLPVPPPIEPVPTPEVTP